VEHNIIEKEKELVASAARGSFAVGALELPLVCCARFSRPH